jgi:hypothetical protein
VQLYEFDFGRSDRYMPSLSLPPYCPLKEPGIELGAAQAKAEALQAMMDDGIPEACARSILPIQN